jgi:hypothetical protein
MPAGIAAMQQQQLINEQRRHNRAMEAAAMNSGRGYWITDQNWNSWYVH